RHTRCYRDWSSDVCSSDLPFPNSGCPNYTLSDSTQTTVCLTRAQIQKEIAAYVSSRSIPTGIGTQIFLFTPQLVGSCTTKTALRSEERRVGKEGGDRRGLR